MRRLPISIAIASLATLTLASSALGWCVETGKDSQRVIDPKVHTKVIGPKGDPFYRLVVKVTETKVTACTGWVRVPDRDWVNGYVLKVRGTDVTVARGERAHLPAGSYVGEWHKGTRVLEEVERFDISCVRAVIQPHAAKVKWHGIGRQGYSAKTFTVPEGCTYRTGWRWLKGRTMTSVVVDGERMERFRTAKPGYYGKLYTGFTRGLTCN